LEVTAASVTQPPGHRRIWRRLPPLRPREGSRLGSTVSAGRSISWSGGAPTR